MRLVTVPNWSFGRDKDLHRRFDEILHREDVRLHYLEGDVDHNRTVTGFTADADVLIEVLEQLALEAFDRIDLNRHTGVHPRIGALDVCPFILRPAEAAHAAAHLAGALEVAERWAKRLAERFEVPVYLYEKSEKGRHESDLPSLRRGGFGSLIGRELSPDFGPNQAHPRLGVTIVGVRDPLIALNVNLATEELPVAKALAAEIRALRADGDSRFLGVRALGLPLSSRGLTQVSVNVTLPDITPVDPIVLWITHRANERNVKVAGTELIGVIRSQDVSGASRLPIKPAQIVGFEA